jgi:hypothetical protein
MEAVGKNGHLIKLMANKASYGDTFASVRCDNGQKSFHLK